MYLSAPEVAVSTWGAVTNILAQILSIAKFCFGVATKLLTVSSVCCCSSVKSLPGTIVCKFVGDPAIYLVKEAICAKRLQTDGRTDRQTTDAARWH